jgi:RNA polymerase sigma-70 factor (ECF subfamily)
MTDRELVERCLKGDASAQHLLFKTHSSKMYALCLRYMGNQLEAEDVLQDSFIKVFERLKQWKGDGPLGGWIRSVVVNTALTQLKSRKKTQGEVQVEEAFQVFDYAESQLQAMQTAELMKMIQEMPDGYRTVFNLFAIEGYAHKEIAEQLGITESTSKTQFLKARNWLIRQLEKVDVKEDER